LPDNKKWRTIARVIDEIQKAALRHIIREARLSDQRLLDRFGGAIDLRPLKNPDDTYLRWVLEQIISYLPTSLSPQIMERDDGQIGAEDRSSFLITNLYQDGNGETWVSCLVATAVRLEGERELDSYRLNLLNKSTFGAINVVGDGVWAITSGGAVLKNQIGASWFEGMSNLYVYTKYLFEKDNGGPAGRYLDGPAGRYLNSKNDSLAGGAAFSPADIKKGAMLYLVGLDGELRDLIDCENYSWGCEIVVPFKMGPSTEFIKITIDGREGMLILSTFPAPFTKAEAVHWCRAFNESVGEEDAANEFRQTTPWLFGSWVWDERDDGLCYITYRGHIMNLLKPMTTTDKLIEGVVKEIWTSWNRKRLNDEFYNTIEESM
jgi:hypothetical protein